VQDARKSDGLHVSDRSRCAGHSRPELAAALTEHGDLIRSEVWPSATVRDGRRAAGTAQHGAHRADLGSASSSTRFRTCSPCRQLTAGCAGARSGLQPCRARIPWPRRSVSALFESSWLRKRIRCSHGGDTSRCRHEHHLGTAVLRGTAAPAAAAVFADAVVTADRNPRNCWRTGLAGAASGMAGSAAAGLAVVGSQFSPHLPSAWQRRLTCVGLAAVASPAVGLAAVASPAVGLEPCLTAVGLAVVASAGSSS